MNHQTTRTKMKLGAPGALVVENKNGNQTT
jgi:hypothetical protein